MAVHLDLAHTDSVDLRGRGPLTFDFLLCPRATNQGGSQRYGDCRDGIDDRESELEPIQGEARHATTLEKGNTGGAEGIRTPDLLIANETRYQLRHSPGKHVRLAAGLLAGCPSGFFIPQGRQLGGVLARRHVARSRPQLVSVIL